MTATDHIDFEPATQTAASGAPRGCRGRQFQIDLRALAALRIGMALVVLWDLAWRSLHLVEFYTDVGVAPRALFAGARSSYTSLYFLSGRPAWSIALFIVHALCALMLLVGYHSRPALLACIIMGWSLMARNPILLHGGDALLLWMMVWSLFLPLGAIVAVDAKTSSATPAPGGDPSDFRRSVCSIATVALLLQVVLVYLGAVSGKTNVAWFSQLSGVHYFLSSHWGTPLGHELAKAEWLTKTLDVATLLLESVVPIAAILAAPLPWLRASLALAMMFFHVCLGLTLYVGTFAAICIVAWVPFLPVEFWDRLMHIRPVRVLASAWDRLIQALANMIRAVFPPSMLVRKIRFLPGRIVSAAIAGLLAYCCAVVLVSALPQELERIAKHLLVFGELRQGWAVMGEPPFIWARMGLEAKLADGSTVVLIDAQAPERAPLRPPIQPRDLRQMKYHLEVLIRTMGGEDNRYADALCRATARKWDATHAPEKRIVSLTVIYDFHQIRPLGVPEDWPLKIGQHPLYKWTAVATGNSRD